MSESTGDSSYDYSGALALFDTNQAVNNYVNGGDSGRFAYDMSGTQPDTLAVYDQLQQSDGAGNSSFADWLAQNYPEIGAQTGNVNTFGQTADDSGGGIVNGLIKGWNALGNNGQILAGSAVLGGLQNYMQQRQRDGELQRMGQMSEEQWQRQMLLKQAPTNNLANVDHFKGIVNSLRGSH